MRWRFQRRCSRARKIERQPDATQSTWQLDGNRSFAALPKMILLLGTAAIRALDPHAPQTMDRGALAQFLFLIVRWRPSSRWQVAERDAQRLRSSVRFCRTFELSLAFHEPRPRVSLAPYMLHENGSGGG
jgi:hypothetical protein